MEGQLLIAQLAVLLEERAAQYRFGRQPLPSGVLDATRPRTRTTRPSTSRCSSSHCDIAFNSWPISCMAKRSNTLGLDGAFLAHCRLRR
jgi:hypothetical protein